MENEYMLKILFNSLINDETGKLFCPLQRRIHGGDLFMDH